jgi:hypothetical protein
MTGYAEQLEFLEVLDDEALEPFGGRAKISDMMLRAARASCDYYIESTPTCGIPYWDTGAPNLHRIEDHENRAADPFNDFEPVDSSAAAIAAQGLLRLGRYLDEDKYWQAGLKVVKTLLSEPYLSTDPEHHGLILNAVYHWPNRWDYIPEGSNIAYGESCMWGDYHAREVVLYLQRLANDDDYLKFYL